MLFRILLSIIYFFNSLHAEGFKEAHIKTRRGPIPIRMLHKGDLVYTMNQDGSLSEKEIEKIEICHSSYFYRIEIERFGKTDEIIAKWGQAFVNSLRNEWVNVCELKVGDYVRCAPNSNSNDYAIITGIERIDIKSRHRYYKFCIKDNNNFFVSHHEVLVHNYLPIAFDLIPAGLALSSNIPISIGAGVAFGPGGLAFQGITVGIGLIGYALYRSFVKNNNHDLGTPPTENKDPNQEPGNNNDPEKDPNITPEKAGAFYFLKKTLDEILEKIPLKKIHSKLMQSTKNGGFNRTVNDFKKFEPSNVKISQNGELMVGKLPNGMNITARSYSKGKSGNPGKPTCKSMILKLQKV